METNNDNRPVIDFSDINKDEAIDVFPPLAIDPLAAYEARRQMIAAELTKATQDALNNPRLMQFKAIADKMAKTFEAKNADYGNSFFDLIAEFGNVAAVIPLANKMYRIKTLVKNGEAKVNESLRDSVLDLANYCIMFAMELDNQSAQ